MSQTTRPNEEVNIDVEQRYNQTTPHGEMLLDCANQIQRTLAVIGKTLEVYEKSAQEQEHHGCKIDHLYTGLNLTGEKTHLLEHKVEALEAKIHNLILELCVAKAMITGHHSVFKKITEAFEDVDKIIEAQYENSHDPKVDYNTKTNNQASCSNQ
ncbi:uncharacterized protein MELLADRAFT_59311 [Melampsora larici-populina 98AG31]|uniref:Uncharacterized protein n=1 Tax=Melampsora larici-populina (strain 98AG31 / pathotype 3-4-7) TaxID=747676 RepID=F4R5U8_MELLP|nr:uncharacterized protein MELLADRAFT_59311 [Melampsora larici-populina 98AG31]EGG12190.1 hypothetical protein MELLADRAFT_59311 [Melampsora larici-populina 98AG31]